MLHIRDGKLWNLDQQQEQRARSRDSTAFGGPGPLSRQGGGAQPCCVRRGTGAYAVGIGSVLTTACRMIVSFAAQTAHPIHPYGRVWTRFLKNRQPSWQRRSRARLFWCTLLS